MKTQTRPKSSVLRIDTMNTLTDWIKQHQVLTFILLTYAMTWSGLFLMYYIFPGNDIVVVLSLPFVVFSPAVSAMLISGIAEPNPKLKNSRLRWIIFLISWLLTSTILFLYHWKTQNMEPGAVLIIIACFWGLFPAWVLSSAYARTPGIRKQFSTLLKPRGPALWYLVIFLIFPGIPLVSFWITRWMGGEARFNLENLGVEGAMIVMLLDFLRGFFMTGGINEESGWRGFAQPRLQARYSVIVASVIVGIVWALWHLPYDLVPDNGGQSLAWFLEYRLFWRVVMAVILTWLYNRTNGSLLAPALFHPAMNVFGNQFFGTALCKVLFIAVLIIALVSDRMWKKLPPDHPAVYQEPKLDG